MYALVLAWPDEPVRIRSLAAGGALQAGDIATVELLGSHQPISWRHDAQGLHIEPPSEPPCKHAYAFKIGVPGAAMRS